MAIAISCEGLSGALHIRTHTRERGRASLRRLNAYEYENAIRDLLAVPWVQIKTKLPQDGEAYRYNKIGTALDVSHVQLSRYMSSADYAMREAMAAKLVQPPTTAPPASTRGRKPRSAISGRAKATPAPTASTSPSSIRTLNPMSAPAAAPSPARRTKSARR